MEKFLSKYLLLVTLLIGTASTAFAGTYCGPNLEYEVDGTTLVLSSPDPSKPATIVTGAFQGNTTITSVVIPSNVTTIGGHAFMRCSALANVDLGNVQSISSYAFDSCFALKEIVIPLSVTSIGVHAFYYCSSLASVLCRPYTAPSLGTDAFTHCADDLKICVSALGEYKQKANWETYYSLNLLTVCFLDEYDNQSTAGDKILYFRTNGKTSIDIYRTLQKAGSSFNTLCLPFNVEIEGSPLAGADVYSFVGATISNGVLLLNISPASSISAGEPYLVRWPGIQNETIHVMHFEDISWDGDNVAASSGSGSVLFQGFYGRTQIYGTETIAEESYTTLFLGGGNNLYYPQNNNGSSMKGFRAYFKIRFSALRQQGAPGMPAVLNILTSPNDATELEVTEPEITDRPRKELRNGQIVIIRNGETFLLNGQKL
ncbi:MAG: leucine-rich repeat domain-containing protein [Paludibacteraceae bacterium]|nr:leucine-rich repeat domain-containing protein [Paludibacteraceae bacterium]